MCLLRKCKRKLGLRYGWCFTVWSSLLRRTFWETRQNCLPERKCVHSQLVLVHSRPVERLYTNNVLLYLMCQYQISCIIFQLQFRLKYPNFNAFAIENSCGEGHQRTVFKLRSRGGGHWWRLGIINRRIYMKCDQRYERKKQAKSQCQVLTNRLYYIIMAH